MTETGGIATPIGGFLWVGCSMPGSRKNEWLLSRRNLIAFEMEADATDGGTSVFFCRRSAGDFRVASCGKTKRAIDLQKFLAGIFFGSHIFQIALSKQIGFQNGEIFLNKNSPGSHRCAGQRLRHGTTRPRKFFSQTKNFSKTGDEPASRRKNKIENFLFPLFTKCVSASRMAMAPEKLNKPE